MVDLQLPASKDDRSSNFSLEGGLDGPHSESFPFSYFPLKGNLVDPRLRASNEHILIVRVPRAGGRPGSLLLLLILSIELRDHLIGQVQLRLIIEHDPHG